MTFSTATIQGYVNWIDTTQTPAGRTVCNMLVVVPDNRKNEAGESVGISTTYKVSIWDKQAITATKYIKKTQVITVNGALKLDDYSVKQGDPKLRLDFASVLDYGKQVIENGEDFIRVTKSNAQSKAKEVASKK